LVEEEAPRVDDPAASGGIGAETHASAAGDAGRQGVVPGPRSLRRALKQLNARRRWGYWVWGIGAGVTVIPELIAAFGAGWLPFTTISKMTGHLERRHSVLELVVIALLVWVVSTVRVP